MNRNRRAAAVEPAGAEAARTATPPQPGKPDDRDLVRDEIVLDSAIWVVKVGTSVLADPQGRLDPDRIHHLSEQICAVMDSGRKVALVSSGAVGAGIGQLGLPRRPENLSELQAVAAVGQSYLIRAYDEGLRRHGRHAAQLLLTHEDFDSRARYLNMRNTLHALFEYNAVPIINENDTISIDEIKFGDNDRLAAMVTNLLQAPLLVILSVVDGLLRTDPVTNARTDEVIPLIPRIDDDVLALAGTSRSALGTGGMKSKLAAAGQVTQAGGSVIIASGTRPEPLTRILAGRRVGTLFLAHGQTHRARKRWIGLTARPRGHYIVDDGARKAMETGSKSLLAIGIVEVSGDFDKGDVVGIRDRDGREFARGLTNYPAADARIIRGLHTQEARAALGSALYDEVVHRDNLVLIS
ncbi:glutamate 5-kinase [Aquisphaera insulae]|uniref:glutamate 5-kinase n=1 Tax=Aquisphaera insulae TaxID=2712864 RepID=UPI0013EB2AD7|nr:glutamate 5-kinase [Aquisphaera insulae]